MKYTCKNCGEDFETFPSRKAVYCSKDCQNEGLKKNTGWKHKDESILKMVKSYNKNSVKTQFKGGHNTIKGAEKGWFKKGVKPWNDQGGKRTLSQILKDDVRWKKWRKAVFERDNYTCQNKECNQRGGELHPHHIKHKVDYPELAFELNNGLTLCVDCHKEKHYGKKI